MTRFIQVIVGSTHDREFGVRYLFQSGMIKTMDTQIIQKRVKGRKVALLFFLGVFARRDAHPGLCGAPLAAAPLPAGKRVPDKRPVFPVMNPEPAQEPPHHLPPSASAKRNSAVCGCSSNGM